MPNCTVLDTEFSDIDGDGRNHHCSHNDIHTHTHTQTHTHKIGQNSQNWITRPKPFMEGIFVPLPEHGEDLELCEVQPVVRGKNTV